MEKTEKDKIEEISSSPYDFRYEEKGFYRNSTGLTKEIVEQLSILKMEISGGQGCVSNSEKIGNEMRCGDIGVQ